MEVTKKDTSVEIFNAGSLSRSYTLWTKRGVIRLGFFIKSERAKKFRDWAEHLMIVCCGKQATDKRAADDIEGA